MAKSNIIICGAEAVIKKQNQNILKERVKKGYRIPQLDEKLRKKRTKKEAKLLEKASKLIPVPKVKKIDTKKSGHIMPVAMEWYTMAMELIEGKKLSDYLDSLPNSLEICKQIGENIAKLHDSNIIHGDLTTSNMIFSEKDNKVYFIDFGLGFESNKTEDKAVDIHLIKQALEAKHFQHCGKFFEAILEGYALSKTHKEIFKRLEKVEKRGRYKQAY